jgi:hypothetical protein
MSSRRHAGDSEREMIVVNKRTGERLKIKDQRLKIKVSAGTGGAIQESLARQSPMGDLRTIRNEEVPVFRPLSYQ